MNYAFMLPRKQPGYFDRERAMALWLEGATDEEIMAEMDVTISPIRKWRAANNLQRNKPTGVEKKPVKKKPAKKLTNLERDAIAAREAGLTYGQYKAQELNAAWGNLGRPIRRNSR